MKLKPAAALVASLVLPGTFSAPQSASAGIVIGGASAFVALKAGLDPRGAGDGAQAFVLLGSIGTVIGASLFYAGATGATGTGFDTLFIVLSESSPKVLSGNEGLFSALLAARYPDLAGDAAIQVLARAMAKHLKTGSVLLENGSVYVSVPKEETLSILEPTGLLEANPSFALQIASELE